MSNEQIKEKYGIEPIMKEMWVWDEDKTESELLLVLYKRPQGDITDYPFFAINNLGGTGCYSNISETNPNDKEPKIGDKGYFWDDSFIKDGSYIFTKIRTLSDNKTYKFVTPYGSYFQHFSHEKQPWMR